MHCVEGKMPFFMPLFGGQAFNGERLTNELFASAKNIFGEDVLQNFLYTLETNFPEGEKKCGKGKENIASTSKPENEAVAACACDGKVPETSPYSCEQFPTFVDLLQKVEEVLQQNLCGKTPEPNANVSKTCSSENEQQKPAETVEKSSVDEKLPKPECKQPVESSEETIKSSPEVDGRLAQELLAARPNKSTEIPEKYFEAQIKTSDFKPEEIRVKVKDGYVTVEAVKEEQDDQNGTSRMLKLNKSFKLPSGTNPDTVTCEITEDGLLKIKAPLLQALPVRERVLTILKEERNG